MSICPCCSHKLLSHINYQRTYLFCPSCWQEMPDLKLVLKANLAKSFTDFQQEKSSQTNSKEFKEIHI